MNIFDQQVVAGEKREEAATNQIRFCLQIETDERKTKMIHQDCYHKGVQVSKRFF